MTSKQERFVAEYLIDLNATQAAIRCGYSAKTAKQQGSRLLTNADIAAAVAVKKAEHLERAESRTVEVLEEYRRLALSDIGNLFDEQGRLKALKDMTPAARATIASVKVTKKNLTAGDGVQEDVVEVKQWDKPKTLRDYGEMLGMFEEKLEISGGIDIRWADDKS